jgi:organic radical activating enzyme
MKPHCNNFCGGNFQDWLEVMLIDKCNGTCSWCVEKNGFKPENHVGWEEICNKIIESGKKNVILLGGEPTLYKDIQLIITRLCEHDINVYITTNGSMLSREYVEKNLVGVKGVNISIHDYKLYKNNEITGVDISIAKLMGAIHSLHEFGAKVRINCNCIAGHIDSKDEAFGFIFFAQDIGADSVRFAELKIEANKFVDLTEIFGHNYGLNDDPYLKGCWCEATIWGMPVNFRQMCGLQTTARPAPENPEQVNKHVLYYDGKFYDGWQIKKENTMKQDLMTEQEILDLLEEVAFGAKTPTQAYELIQKHAERKAANLLTATVMQPVSVSNGSGCMY